jgi:phthiocerol/phenolphthiocerol synthesis type-I polyketide synthase C
VKSNLGHLETASGVAGLVKALHCLQPPRGPGDHRRQDIVNPNIKLADWNLDLVTSNRQLKKAGKLIIGVNSFGFGGANAHVILESPCLPSERREPALPAHRPAARSSRRVTAPPCRRPHASSPTF